MKKIAYFLRVLVVLAGVPVALLGQEEPAPEISVELASAPGVELAPDNRISMGTLPESGSVTLNLIIRNAGTAPLTGVSARLPDISPIVRPGQTRPFVITASVPYPYIIQPGSEAVLTITANDNLSHPLVTRLVISSDDADEPVTTYQLEARSPFPELRITYQGRPAIPADLDFGTLKVGESATRTFLLENPGLQPVDVEVDFEGYDSMEVVNMSLLSPAGGTVTIPPGGTSDLTVEFRPLSADHHQRDIDIHSTAHHSPPHGLTLRGESYTNTPAFNYRFPARFMVQGDSDGVPAHAEGDDVINYEWTKNGNAYRNTFAEPGALSFWPVKPTDAGIYQVRATNDAGSVLSTDIPVFVTSNLPPQYFIQRGSPVTIKTALHLPPGCTLVESYWNHETAQAVTRLVDGPLYRGTQTLALTVRSTTDATVGGYRCTFKVQLPSGEIVEGYSDFVGLDTAKAPVFHTSLQSGSLTVGDLVYNQVGEWVANGPTSFAAFGLPPGITLHPTTGLLTGRPTTPRYVNGQPAPYTARISARNGYGVAGATLELTVYPREDFLIGSFTGLVERNDVINDGLGGALQVTLTRYGSYSGRLALGGRTYPLSGSLNWTRSIEFTITRPAPLSSLLVSVSFSSQEEGKLVGHVQRIAASLGAGDFAGLDLHRVLNGSARAADAFDGYYTAALQHAISAGDPAAPGGYPKGRGFVALTVRPAGTFTWAGRLADGSAMTGASAITEGGKIAFYQAFHAGTASVQGWSTITADTLNFDGTLDWLKAAEPAAKKSRSYAAGIPLHNLALTGGLYAKPAANTRLLGCDPVSPNAALELQSDALENDILQPFTLTAHHTADVPANESKLRITSLNAATGLFGGTFTATDPLTPVKRAGTFNGIIVNRLNSGVGHALLPALPASAGQSPNQTPILSGPVEMNKQ